MSRMTSFVTIVIALAASTGMPAWAAPGAHGPGGEHLDAPGVVSGTGLARLPDGSVHVPKLAQRRMGIRTALPQEATHSMTVELNAVVAIDPNAGGRLQAGHAGWIEPPPGGFPVLGQRVARGQVLAVLRHKNEPFDTGNQQARLASLSADLKLAQQRLARLESLQDSIPRKEIEAARAEVRSLSGQRDAVGKSLRHTDNLTAPASGIVATANVLAGQVVAPGDVLYEVLDPERMLIEARTADATLAGRIQGGTLGRADGGNLEFVGAGRSLKNGAVPLMFRLGGKTVPLAVGEPVTVVATLTDTARGIALPAEALVRNASNLPVVWIKSGTQRFIAQPVEARVLDARTVVVVKGLSPENRVVVSGAALISQIR